MIPILLAMAAATLVADDPEAQFRNCTQIVRSDPAKALSVAGDWRVRGGGIAARQCMGLAYTGLERWSLAAEAFEKGAQEAAETGDPRVADLWTQAGNAWLGAGDAAKARTALDAALQTDALAPGLRGEVHLDRARAGVMLDELGAARNDINKGLELVPEDPFAWYLSSALALREGDMARAKADIEHAVGLAPDDADVLVQAGTVIGTTGDLAGARTYYERAIALAPGSDAARAAQAALDTPPTERLVDGD